MLDTIRHQWQAKVVVILFLLLTVFWISLQLGFYKEASLFDHSVAKFFGAIYGIVALWGGIWGIVLSKKMGWN